MRKDGQPHVFKRVKLKDLYNQIKNGEMTERSFKEWLKLYSYKHWGRGWDDGFESQAERQVLTDEEIADLIKATNDETGWGHIRIFDFAKVLLRKAQEK
jgi:hypothetical protein